MTPTELFQYSYVSTAVISRKFWNNLLKSFGEIHIVTTQKLLD